MSYYVVENGKLALVARKEEAGSLRMVDAALSLVLPFLATELGIRNYGGVQFIRNLLGSEMVLSGWPRYVAEAACIDFARAWASYRGHVRNGNTKAKPPGKRCLEKEEVTGWTLRLQRDLMSSFLKEFNLPTSATIYRESKSCAEISVDLTEGIGEVALRIFHGAPN